MATFTKATMQEKDAYMLNNPVHPLCGWLTVRCLVYRKPYRCAVEWLGEGPGEPNYEVLAPSGYHFSPEGTHTLLATDRKDLRFRVSGNLLEQCGTQCEVGA